MSELMKARRPRRLPIRVRGVAEVSAFVSPRDGVLVVEVDTDDRLARPVRLYVNERLVLGDE